MRECPEPFLVGDITGVEWVETRDAANHTAVHVIAPTTKNCPVHKVNHAPVGGPELRETIWVLRS